MKLEVGMYCRYRNFKGEITIDKIKRIQDYIFFSDNWITKNNIIKASFNIIDILEKGDIISYLDEKHEILLIDDELMVRNTGLIYDNNYYLPIKSITIKSVITHEQMEQMAYKVG